MRPRGIIRDILMLFVGYHVIKYWITGESISIGVGLSTLVLMYFASSFLIERFKS
jgi:hypothetical protein